MGGIQYIYHEEDYFAIKRDIVPKCYVIHPDVVVDDTVISNDMMTPLQYLYKKLLLFLEMAKNIFEICQN